MPGSSGGKVMERFFLLIEPLEAIDYLSSTKYLSSLAPSVSAVSLDS